MGRNQKVVCEKCFCIMRRDNVERHMQQHENRKLEAESFHGSSFSASTTSSESNFSSVFTLLPDLVNPFPSMRRQC